METLVPTSFAHYPTDVGVLILGIDSLIKFIFELYFIILVFYSVAGGERLWISLLGPQQTFIS